MKALVVFESMFGNNEQVARAIAEGLASHASVETFEVGAAPSEVPTDIDLLLVGGPNHGLGMSTPRSRADAAKRASGSLVSSGIGLREWLEALPAAPEGTAAVAWDTRLRKPFFLRWFDRSSRGIEKRLRGRGYRLAEPARHFTVTATEGPLAPGEIERARAWGADLVSAASAT